LEGPKGEGSRFYADTPTRPYADTLPQGGASPYLSALSRHDVIPDGMRRAIDRAIPEGFTFTSGITREAPVRAEPHPTSWCASAGREAEASIFNRPRSRAHSRYRSLIVTVQRAGRTRTSTIGRTEGGRLLLLRRHVHTPVRSPTPPQGKLRSLSDPFVSPRGDPRQS
jgi:hypothetical protein